MCRQPVHLADDAGGDGVHVAAVELDEHDVTRRAFHDRGHLGPVPTEQQVAFPVARHRPVLDLRGPLADRHRISDLGPPLARDGVVQVAARRAPSPQMLLQLLGQHASRLHEQRLVDRLVRHRDSLAHRLLFGQHPGDLLRRPVCSEPTSDIVPQRRLASQQAALRAPSASPRSIVGIDRPIHAAPLVAGDLSADRRRRPTELTTPFAVALAVGEQPGIEHVEVLGPQLLYRADHPLRRCACRR